MKNIKRVVLSALCLLLCCVLFLFGTGCAVKTAALLRFNMPEKFDKLKTTCVAENDNFSLIWNAESSRVILYDKIKDCEWSYVPYESINSTYDEEGFEANNHPRLESPITVNYYATANSVANETNASAQSINGGNFTLKKIDNGLEMVCYFKKYEFTIPITFVLVDDGIKISIDPERIEENEQYCISSIVIAPFFCSIANENADKEGHYMFVPSGSGTLLYPTYTTGIGTTTSEPVYGGDENIETDEQVTTKESVRLPVYGAVNGDRAVCAIIEDGAEYAYINTMTGQALTKYSYVTSEFRVRGYQEAVQTLFTSSVVKTKLYADGFADSKMTVGFYPLYDEDASYVGMAQKYREHLEKEEQFAKKTSDDKLLNLKLVGGIETKKFIFGIPSGDMLVTTTVKQAEEIIKELNEKAGVGGINANLIGFGSNGNDIGTVAGGYEIGGKFGDDDDLIALNKYCQDNNVNLFMNFDMVRFSSSGGGVSTSFGRADAANGSYTIKSYYDVNFRISSTSLRNFYLVSRTKLPVVAESIKEAAKDWKLKGLSLDTLTSMVYSDYSDREYYSASNSDKQFSAIINSFKNDGYKIAGSDANGFAAELCDHVYDVPYGSSKYRVFTVDVPFYQIVFKGEVSMSTTSLNLATNKETTLLEAVETGSGLTYTLVADYDTRLINSAQNVFYGSLYWDEIIERGVKTDIIETVAEYKDYFESVKNANIVNHEILTEKVRKTTFSNGVSVYVNYGDTEYQSNDGVVAARSYITVKGA